MNVRVFKLRVTVHNEKMPYSQFRRVVKRQIYFYENYGDNTSDFREDSDMPDSEIIQDLPIQKAIDKFLYKYFNDDEHKTAFITDYKEREGSFVITFSIIAIYAIFIEYGSIRQSIDYFKKDFHDFIKMVTREEVTVKEFSEYPLEEKSRKSRRIKNKELILQAEEKTNLLVLILLAVILIIVVLILFGVEVDLMIKDR